MCSGALDFRDDSNRGLSIIQSIVKLLFCQLVGVLVLKSYNSTNTISFPMVKLISDFINGRYLQCGRGYIKYKYKHLFQQPD